MNKLTLSIAGSILLSSLSFGALLSEGQSVPKNEAVSDKMNVLLILIDDLGWQDVSYMGSEYYETPNIDTLASQGMTFTHAYAASSVCSPTRASIMTGKYPARLHLTDWISGHPAPAGFDIEAPDWTKYLDTTETTLGDVFQSAGYKTASIGKWHLGSEPYFPEHNGFDVNIGGNHYGRPDSYWWPYTRGENDTNPVPDLPGGEEGEYLTDRLTTEAITFMEENRYRPFFLYFPYYAVHTPIEGKEDLKQKYQAKDGWRGQDDAEYAAMIETVDTNVGRLMQALEDLDLADNTIVVFFSDNGGLNRVTNMPDLRGSKGQEYEGGIREPLIMKVPDITTPGSSSEVPVISNDFLPTLASLAGIDIGDLADEIDGLDITPLLTQSGTPDRDTLYWHYPHWHSLGGHFFGRIRKGDWVLIEYFDGRDTELYNLANDPREQNNLADTEPAKRDELLNDLATWRTEVGAQMPVPR